MRTAKEILADFPAKAAFAKSYAERQGFKEQYLQAALDEAWEAGMKEAAEIANETHKEWMRAYNNGEHLPTVTITDAILARVKERKKT